MRLRRNPAQKLTSLLIAFTASMVSTQASVVITVSENAPGNFTFTIANDGAGLDISNFGFFGSFTSSQSPGGWASVAQSSTNNATGSFFASRSGTAARRRIGGQNQPTATFPFTGTVATQATVAIPTAAFGSDPNLLRVELTWHPFTTSQEILTFLSSSTSPDSLDLWDPVDGTSWNVVAGNMTLGENSFSSSLNTGGASGADLLTVQFQQIPEPSTTLTLLCGGLLMFRRRVSKA